MRYRDITTARQDELFDDIEKCETVAQVKSLIAGGFGDDDIILHELHDDIYQNIEEFASLGLTNINALFIHAISRIEELS